MKRFSLLTLAFVLLIFSSAFAQTPPPAPALAEDDPALVPILLWQLDKGYAPQAEELLRANLTRIRPRLEAVLQDIDRQFDILGRFGAVSIYFGPGYGDLNASNDRHEKLFTLYRKVGGDESLYQRFEARRLRVEGAHYTNQGEIACGDHLNWDEAQTLYTQALDRLNEALKIAQQLKDVRLIASAKVNIGSTLIRLGRPDEAIQAYNEGVQVADTMPADLYKGLLRMNLGNTYVWLGQPDKSLAYSQQALTLFRKMGRGTWEANALMILGNAYLRQRDFANAWTTLQSALQTAKQNGEYRIYGRALLNLGMTGVQLKKKEAIPMLEEALAWYKNDKEIYPAIEREAVLQDGLKFLSQVAQQTGDKALAEKYQKQYVDEITRDVERYKALRASPCYAIYMSRPMAAQPTSQTRN